MPCPERTPRGQPLNRRFSGIRRKAAEQLRGRKPLPSESVNHARVVAPGKAMEQDSTSAQRDAERGSAIIVSLTSWVGSWLIGPKGSIEVIHR